MNSTLTKKQQRVFAVLYFMAGLVMLCSPWLLLAHTVSMFETGNELSSGGSLLMLLGGTIMGPGAAVAIGRSNKVSSKILIRLTIAFVCTFVLLVSVRFHTTVFAIDWYFYCDPENGSTIGACNSLGKAFAEGDGVPKNRAKAMFYSEIGCDDGWVMGCVTLTKLKPENVSEKTGGSMKFFCEWDQKDCLSGKDYMCDSEVCSILASSCPKSTQARLPGSD